MTYFRWSGWIYHCTLRWCGMMLILIHLVYHQMRRRYRAFISSFSFSSSFKIINLIEQATEEPLLPKATHRLLGAIEKNPGIVAESNLRPSYLPKLIGPNICFHSPSLLPPSLSLLSPPLPSSSHPTHP